MSWITKLKNSKFIVMGFRQNQFIFFHILAASLLFNGLVAVNVVWWLAMIIVFVVAIIWEFVEFYVECGGKWENVKSTYGSIEKWKYDTAGDIIGAYLVVLIQLIGLL